jgi:hypothetical protein
MSSHIYVQCIFECHCKYTMKYIRVLVSLYAVTCLCVVVVHKQRVDVNAGIQASHAGVYVCAGVAMIMCVCDVYVCLSVHAHVKICLIKHVHECILKE